MEQWIEQEGHHPRGCCAFESGFVRIVKLPILPQRTIGRSSVGRLKLMFVICVNTFPGLGPIALISGHLPTMQNTQQATALMSKGPDISAAFGINTKRTGLAYISAIPRLMMLNAVLGH